MRPSSPWGRIYHTYIFAPTDPLDLKAFFRSQLDYERLALWLHTKAAALVPSELGPHFQKIAREEEKHIGMTEEIVRRLETTYG